MDIVNFGNSCFLTLVSTLKLLHRMQILCLLEIYSILLIGMIKMYEITVCLCHKDISAMSIVYLRLTIQQSLSKVCPLLFLLMRYRTHSSLRDHSWRFICVYNMPIFHYSHSSLITLHHHLSTSTIIPFLMIIKILFCDLQNFFHRYRMMSIPCCINRVI